MVIYNPQQQAREDAMSVVSINSRGSKSTRALPNGTAKAIEYLKIGSDQRENIKDYILNTRDILKSQIMINDFTDEMERLKIYIKMAHD